MARTDPQVNLRMPELLKTRLDEAAERNKRSLTAEIVERLTLSIHDEGMEELDNDRLRDVVQLLRKRLEAAIDVVDRMDTRTESKQRRLAKHK